MEIRILENISTIPNYDISNIKNYFDGGKVPAKYFQFKFRKTVTFRIKALKPMRRTMYYKPMFHSNHRKLNGTFMRKT